MVHRGRRKPFAISNCKGKGLKPCGARFRDSGNNNIRIFGLEVILKKCYGLNLSRLAPKSLEEIEIVSSPTSFSGKRENKIFTLLAKLFFKFFISMMMITIFVGVGITCEVGCWSWSHWRESGRRS